MDKKITFIEANKPLQKLLRVCAYARVSSDKEEMLNSLSNQVSHYNELISNHKGWLFCGVYTDEGISGTKLDRPQFLKMLQDARDGKFDMIVTKSISRFARNTKTVIKTIRELNSLKIDVFFESQNMHTLSADGEFMLTVLASYYQEEARSVSENMKWRIKRDFEEGKLWGSGDHYGYKLINRKLIVVPKQAEVVKRIFDLYISGCGFTKIAVSLNEEGIKSLRNEKWNKTAIQQIIRNVNYTGDLLLQKTFSADYLTKKRKYNRGHKQKYYVEDDHEPIVSKKVFELANSIREERDEKFKVNRDNSKIRYPFTGILKCETCGKFYRHKKTAYKDVWICETFNQFGKKYCASKQIPEHKLYDAINEYLGLKEFDKELFRKTIDYIVVKQGNKLELHLTSGKVDEITWEDASRSKGWTPEMREAANKRSTNVLNGYSSYNQSTGGTNSIATSTGYLTSNNRMKYRGIEDFSGNDAVWMPDVTGAYYTSRDVETYKSGTVNKTQLSYYRNITASQSWRNIQALGWDDNNPFICLPSKLGSASSTTYFGTNMYGPNGNNDYLSRSKLYSGYKTNANLLTSVFDYTYSSATDTTTSRLIKYEI